ncbi:MAG TPA: methyltransferase domain-containing protein [Longimicrobiaceae bacterium]|nr:methyltransferase domain-containing protein [Longimicrobiaceae bacterium]
MRRRREPELMDRADADRAELRKSLRDLRGVNRWLGGRRSAVALVLDLAGRVPADPVRVLDVGTGGADIPLDLVAAGRRRGLGLRVTATDIHPGTLEYARQNVAGEPSIEVIRADAMDLPFAPDEFDLVISSTTLHHFARDEAVRAMREMDRVGRYGVIATDLARSMAAWVGARLLAATVWRRHPITRHDGPVSVRAAFTVEEMRQMAAEAFGGGFDAQPQPVFRLAVVVDRTPRAEGRGV